MDASYLGFWMALAGGISMMLVNIAGIIKLWGEAKYGRERFDAIDRKQDILDGKVDAVNVKVDGQLDRARQAADRSAERFNQLLGRVKAGDFAAAGMDAEAVRLEVLRDAEEKAAALREAAEIVAEQLRETARDVAARLRPADAKAAALDAVHDAVEHERARTSPVAEVRRIDEHD